MDEILMENGSVSCQHTLGSPPDQLVARGEHGSPAPETLNSPDPRAEHWARDGGLPAGGPWRGGVFQPPSLSSPAGGIGERGARLLCLLQKLLLGFHLVLTPE